MNIGKEIQVVFGQSGFTVSQFAQMLGIKRTCVYTIFKSKTISTDLLCKISDVLHYDFLTEFYLNKRESSTGHNTITIQFHITADRYSDFIQIIKKLKKANIIH